MVPIPTALRASKMMQYGLIAALIGTGLVGYGVYGDATLPARGELHRLTGQVQEATKVTTTRRRGGSSVRYDLKFAPDAPLPAGGTTPAVVAPPGSPQPPVTISIPDSLLRDDNVRAIIRERVELLATPDLDVFGLSLRGRDLIRYEHAIGVRKSSNNVLEWMGAGLAGLGLLAVLVFYAWTSRRLSREAEPA